MAGRLNVFRRCPFSTERSGPTRVDGVVPAVLIPREAPRQSDCRGEPPKAEKGENRIHWRTSVFKLQGTTAERPFIGSAGTRPARTHRHQLNFRQSGPAPHIRVWLGRHDLRPYGFMASTRSFTRPLGPLALPPKTRSRRRFGLVHQDCPFWDLPDRKDWFKNRHACMHAREPPWPQIRG